MWCLHFFSRPDISYVISYNFLSRTYLEYLKKKFHYLIAYKKY